MQKISLLLAVVSILLGSCQHYYYAPNTLNIPTLREKGDATLDAGLIGGNNFSGWEARAAYSPINRLAVTFNHTQMSGSFEDGFFDFTTGTFISQTKSGKGHLTEGGLGYYYPYSQYATLSLSGGGGFGSTYNDFGKAQFARLNLNRIYLQPALSIKGELAEFGCGVRISRLAFNAGEIIYNVDNPEIQVLKKIESKSPFLLTDFGMYAGLNLSPVHLRCHFVFSLFEANEAYGFSGNNAALSMTFDLHRLWKQKK
jgi:hypothetical protein